MSVSHIGHSNKSTLPLGWKCRPLGDLADITMGNSPPGNSYNEDGIGVPLINGPVEFSEGAFGITSMSKYTTAPTKMCEKGDFLICVRGSTTGRTNIAAFDACIGRGVAAIHSHVDQGYVNHFVRTLEKKIHAAGKGSTFPSISQQQLQDLQVPVPHADDYVRSMQEQKRIADILDKADAIRRKRQDCLAGISMLIDSVFSELIGHVPSRRSQFPIKPLRPYLEASNGKSSGSVLSDKPTGIPIYGGNGINGWASSSLYDEPVVVVGRVGQQCGITSITSGPAWITDNAIAVRPKDRSKVDLVYLEAAVRRSTLGHDVRYIDLPYINQSMILDLPLPLPPIEVQREFVHKKREIEKTIAVATSYFDRATDLFNSLIQCAFKGAL